MISITWPFTVWGLGLVGPLKKALGGYVFCLVQSNKDRHKLTPPWEGPFIVVEMLRPGTHKLESTDSKVFTNAWNIEQLRLFYP
jgi:hypothetical protein